ncbi:MAG: RNA pseudouridine synthase [Gammaproteobacteria bacterium]|nr:MAG: RNA pseudouridine synthase [Gammaproteobacteria bacterium]
MTDKPYYIVPYCDKEVKILYEDEALLVVVKPDLLLSVPGRAPENKDCLITRLQQTHPSATIVHRLDLDTSGLMIIPLQKAVHVHISRQFQERQVQKEYIAIVYGDLKVNKGEINFPVASDWPNRPKQIVDYGRGKSALTHYEVISRDPKRPACRVRLTPTTGRTHQLRLHFKAIHHPILGCDMYAHETALNMVDRLMLHARSLSFTHPLSGQMMTHISEPDF